MLLGIDCGSVGVKSALLDESGAVVETRYLRNTGLLESLKAVIPDKPVDSIGVTGSGRHLAAIISGAGVVETEILAHSISAISMYPDVNTILDIGGEDCKIIKIRNGTVVDFRMNQVCGAGTGSILDAIAARMGIDVTEIADIALKSQNTLSFPGKCGIFTQSSVVSRLNAGADKSDILMGVINALVSNFLMLGKGIELRPPYVFQGAVALNKAVVKSLCDYLGDEVVVPEYAPYMGAIGVAMMANGSTLKRSVCMDDLSINTRIAAGCDNRCEISIVRSGGDIIGWIGNRCDKCVPK